MIGIKFIDNKIVNSGGKSYCNFYCDLYTQNKRY